MNCAPARWGYVSIGDSYSNRNSRSDSFLPDQTTRGLAEQTNATLQDAVRRDGQAYVQHLDRFIIALQEELDSQGPARLPPAIDRATYRNDVKNDGTSIESRGWFRGPVANDAGNKYRDDDDSITMPRLCALHWVIVLYESVVPDELKADVSSKCTDRGHLLENESNLRTLLLHFLSSMLGNSFMPLFINW